MHQRHRIYLLIAFGQAAVNEGRDEAGPPYIW